MEWLTTSASCASANLRYANRYISRSPNISSLLVVPGCETQPRLQPCVKAVTGRAVGPVNVVFAGTAKSTWNFHKLSLLAPKSTKNPGSPEEGWIVPSRSTGNKVVKALDCWK